MTSIRWVLIGMLSLLLALITDQPWQSAPSADAQGTSPTPTAALTEVPAITASPAGTEAATPIQPGATATEIPVPAATLSPTATTVALADLILSIFAAPDPAQPGNDLTYTLRAFNTGDAAAGPFTITNPLPDGVVFAVAGPDCSLIFTATVACNASGLAPGAAVTRSFTVRVIQQSGTITNEALVDSYNSVQERSEGNNVASLITGISVSVTPPSVATATVLPIAPPTVPSPTPVPPSPTPLPTPIAGQIWLHVLEPTQSYSVIDEPLWVAEPGEWYFLEAQEERWALAIFEGDTADDAVWIELDGRVELVITDRPVPGGMLWLHVLAETELYAPDMAQAGTAGPDEWYRISLQEPEWVLAAWEFAPQDNVVWIQMDDRVELVRR